MHPTLASLDWNFAGATALMLIVRLAALQDAFGR